MNQDREKIKPVFFFKVKIQLPLSLPSDTPNSVSERDLLFIQSCRGKVHRKMRSPTILYNKAYLGNGTICLIELHNYDTKGNEEITSPTLVRIVLNSRSKKILKRTCITEVNENRADKVMMNCKNIFEAYLNTILFQTDYKYEYNILGTELGCQDGFDLKPNPQLGDFHKVSQGGSSLNSGWIHFNFRLHENNSSDLGSIFTKIIELFFNEKLTKDGNFQLKNATIAPFYTEIFGFPDQNSKGLDKFTDFAQIFFSKSQQNCTMNMITVSNCAETTTFRIATFDVKLKKHRNICLFIETLKLQGIRSY